MQQGAMILVMTPGPECRTPERRKAHDGEPWAFKCLNGRGEKIRTSDPLLPKQVRYQAALRPD
jgi:hypothetical protein